MDFKTAATKPEWKKVRGNILTGVLKELNKNKALYSMAIPGVVLLFLFNYMPLFGLLVAFKNFNFADGILGSEWAKPFYNNFTYIFSSSSSAMRATVNTLFLNTLFIVFGIIFQVGLALIFNELGGKWFKKITQSFMLLPYFISWIVVGVIAYNLLNVDNGVVNSVLQSNGIGKVDWYIKPELWPAIMVVFYVWKSTGYGMVLYLASLAGIDPTYYEAAALDGATRWQQIKHITLPFLKPTIITLLLLHVGRIMNADFGMFYSIVGDNSALFSTVDVVDTFVFRSLRLNGDIGMASAAGFYQSSVAFVIIVICNKLTKKFDEGSSLF